MAKTAPASKKHGHQLHLLPGLQLALEEILELVNARRKLIGSRPFQLVVRPLSREEREAQAKLRQQRAAKEARLAKKRKEADEVRAKLARRAETESDAETLRKFRQKLKTGRL